MNNNLKKGSVFHTVFLFQLFILLVFLPYSDSFGQELNQNRHRFKDNWVVDLNVGYSTFFGDASNKGYFGKFFKELGFSSGLTARKMFVPAFGLGLNFQYARLYSLKDKNSLGQPVNFEMIGNYMDFNVHGYVDYGSLFWGYNEKRWFTVYSTIGLGIAYFNTTLYDHATGMTRESGQTYGGIKYGKVGAVVPIGLGMNFKVSPHWAINVEGNLRTVLSDKVDVWDDGFPVDQPFLTSVGISYYINYGFHSKRKSSCGCNKTATTTYPSNLEPIPFYDYNRWSTSYHRSLNQEPVKPVKINLDTLEIEDNTKSTDGIVYRVQILAKKEKLKDLALFKQRYGITDDIHENYQDGIYRYSIGYFRNYQDALKYSKVIKNKGVFDAFVVVYKDNVRIPLTPELMK